MMKSDRLIFGRASQTNAQPGSKEPFLSDIEMSGVQDSNAKMNTIYHANQPSDEFYLIIKGKVLVCSGKEGFYLELSSFNVIGVDALTNDRYTPDFSAKAIEKTRLLRVKRGEYRKALMSGKNINS